MVDFLVGLGSDAGVLNILRCVPAEPSERLTSGIVHPTYTSAKKKAKPRPCELSTRPYLGSYTWLRLRAKAAPGDYAHHRS